MMNKIQKIVDVGLCIGCGLCETIATSQKCQMKLNKKRGFYFPEFKQELTFDETRAILNCCPGIKINGNKTKTEVWGNIEQIEEAWSKDPIIREKASSGGIITTLALHLLDTNKVDGVLQVGVSDNSYLYNNLKISKTKEDIFKNIGSRYAPALVFNQLCMILDRSKEKYAFIGKPCDIAGIKNFIAEYPKYKNRIIYFLSIFCAGIPSYNGTKKIIEKIGYDVEPNSIKYRGDGWPGYFEAKYEGHPPFKISYNDSWGKVLGKHLGFRCKICPDGIGLLADIVVGDSWNTKDGYPDFEETEGRSFVMVRTTNGVKLYRDALVNNKIESKPFRIDSLKQIQNYQYKRRLYSGYRLIPVLFKYGFIIKYKNIGLMRLMLKANIYHGLGNTIGTLKRYKKN